MWKKFNSNITTDQIILNVLKNIEHENIGDHPLFSTQTEVTEVMSNITTKYTFMIIDIWKK